MDREFYDELVKENKKKKIIIVVTLIIILLLVGIGIFIYYKKTSQNYLKETIINIFNYPEKDLIESKSLGGQYKIEFNGTTVDSENKALFKVLNNLDINFNIKLDTEEKIIDYELQSDYYGEELINFNVYSEKEQIYYLYNGIYDKYIQYDLNTLTDEIDIDLSKTDDYKIILSKIQESLKENLKEEYFTKEKTTLNNQKVTKNTMIIDENNCLEFEENFYNYLLEDKEFVESYANIKNIEEEKVKEEIVTYLEELKQEKYNIELSLYTNYFNFVKLEIKYNDEKLDITKSNNTKYEYVYQGKATYIGSLDIEKDKEKEEITFKIKDSQSKNIMDIKITGNLKTGIKVNKKDISNSIKADEINEQELIEMSKALAENEAFIKLIMDLLETEYSNILNDIV